MRVLLVEDDATLGRAVRDHVAAAGHAVDWADRVQDARDHLAVADYHLVLLDMALPDGRGMGVLKDLRGQGKDAAVIILSAEGQIAERIAGLNAGADDYLTKPFDLSELSARMAAVERRYTGRTAPVTVIGNLTLDLGAHVANKDGQPVDLTAREWAVLARLARTRHATVPKSEIEEALYAFGAEVDSNAVEVYVSRLRRKLGRDLIRTVRGLGYALVEES